MSRPRRNCDGLPRRDMLKIGAASALGWSLSLPELLDRMNRSYLLRSQSLRFPEIIICFNFVNLYEV